MQWELIHVVCINHEQSHIDLRRGVEVFVRQLEGKKWKRNTWTSLPPLSISPWLFPTLGMPIIPTLAPRYTRYRCSHWPVHWGYILLRQLINERYLSEGDFNIRAYDLTPKILTWFNLTIKSSVVAFNPLGKWSYLFYFKYNTLNGWWLMLSDLRGLLIKQAKAMLSADSPWLW